MPPDEDDPLAFAKAILWAIPLGALCWLILLTPLWVWLWC